MLQTETLSLVRTAPAPDVLEEFEKQVKAYEKAFYHFAYRLTGNHDDAEDLTQEALLKAYRAFHRFKTGTAFDRWVYQIIYRLFIDQYRKKRRRPFVASLDESPPYLDREKPKEVPDHSKLPEDFALRHELGETIQKALLRLPEEFRAAVVLCDVQGFSYEEISNILQCSLGTVRSRIHRGRRQLREQLHPYLN
ncbi:MAG: sigma-70 family RNA polymerase sigma factor, partial [Firmicutes bacterium]|nr:sigma-70 family RNA polymerase sigma factor [Bacillota bacterium]